MWSARRRAFIILVVIAALALLIFVPITIRNLAVVPTCTDGRQNADETGVDCGGSCVLVCRAQAAPLIVEWARVVPVTSTVYNMAFLAHNRNYDAIARNVPYRCALYDAEHNKLQEQKGNMTVSPAGKMTQIETGLEFPAENPPVTARCEFSTNHQWLRLPAKSLPSPFDYQSTVIDSEGRPSVTTMASSLDPNRTFSNVGFVASVWDSTDTLVAVSRTLVDTISPTNRYPLVFTWPQALGGVGPYRATFSAFFEFPEYINWNN